MRQTLRSQQPPGSSIASHELTAARLAAPANPIVESWLESIHPSPSSATTATTTAAYDPLYYGSNPKSNPVSNRINLFPTGPDKERKWVVIRSGLRATSLTLALIVMILIFCFGNPRYSLDPVWIPVLTLCAIAMLCNGLDLGIAAGRGRGIPNNIHAFTDCALAIGILITVALVIVQIVDWFKHGAYSTYDGPYRIAIACILLIKMAIHLCLFFSYFNDIRPSRRLRDTHMPRIMVLPSGAAVMVTPRSLPRDRGVSRPSAIEMNMMGPASAPSSAIRADRQQSMESGRVPQPTVLAISRTAPLIATTSPNTIPLNRPEPAFDASWPPRQTVPPRKPLAGRAVVTGAADYTTSSSGPQRPAIQTQNQHVMPRIPPPGSDYQPDEAELERAARGEAQAQWIPPHLAGLRRGDNGPRTSVSGPEYPEQD